MKLFSQIAKINSFYFVCTQILIPNNIYRLTKCNNKSTKSSNLSSSSSLFSTNRKHKSFTNNIPKSKMIEGDMKKVKLSDNTYFAKRKWKSVRDNDMKSLTGTSFTIMSYNVLSQDLLNGHQYLYANHEQKYLHWEYRFKFLINEIQYINPEILCLQEVQKSHLNEYIVALKQLNLDQYIYKKRTFSDKTDGCAIFYNSKKFNLLAKETLEYFQPNVKLLDKPNVGILAKFAPITDQNSCFVVSTTHLLYNPRRQDIRLAQIQLLLAELDRISSNGRSANGKLQYLPSILTGDFNLEPHSAPYMLLTNGKFSYENCLIKSLERCSNPSSSSESVGKYFLPPELDVTDHCQHLPAKYTKLYHSDKKVNDTVDVDASIAFNRNAYPFSTGTLRHKLHLSTVYNATNDIASTFQDDWILVDYMFYSKIYNSALDKCEEGSLKLMATYELPTYEDCYTRIGAIPNKHLGSDHLSLASKFILLPTNDRVGSSKSTKR